MEPEARESSSMTRGELAEWFRGMMGGVIPMQ